MIPSADLIIQNARVNTMDPARPVVESVAIWKSLILAVGTESDILSLASPETIKLNLGGRTVLPGFIDAHEHLSIFSEESLKLNCSPQNVSSISELVNLVKNTASRVDSGQWIQGVLYDDTKMSEGRLLTRDDLDVAAPDNPVIIVHVSCHWAVVNSFALKAGGLNDDSPNPKGGVLGREPGTSRLDGRLIEMAMFNFAFESMTDQPTVVPPFSRELRRKALLSATQTLNAAGICGVGDALTAPSYITSYHDLAAALELSIRVNMMVPYIFLPRLEKIGLLGPWGNEWVRCGGIKVIIDGAIAGRTAALKDGYADDPTNKGVLLIEDEASLDEIVERIHCAGYQACVHANGDLAIEMALNAIEKAQIAYPRKDPRHRIEHCTMINDEFLSRMARLGVLALPFGSYLFQHGEKLKRFYGNRADRMFAHNSFLKAGVKVAGSSDHPAGLYPPLLGVQSMVTRRTGSGEIIGAQEKISLQEAFRMYTVYAAYASGEERIKGRLAPGMLADIVVLDKDPWSCRPEEISTIDVYQTIVGGQTVFGPTR